MAGRGPTLARLAAVAVGYYALGRLAVLLAVSPRYALAVWPPAGLALVAVLRSRRCAPAVAAGALVVNLHNLAGMLPPAAWLVTATSLAAGATLQALLGAALVRRALAPAPGGAAARRGEIALDEEQEILWLLGAGGAAACAAGAVWSTAVLGASGTVATADLAFSAWTWWVGDTIGVVIFAPLIMAVLGRPRERWRGRRLVVALPLVVGFAVVTLLFMRAEVWERRRIDAELDGRAAALTHAVEQHAAAAVEAVEALAGMVAAVPSAGAAPHAQIARGMRARSHAVLALGFAPRVSGAERAAFEAAAQQADAPDFRVRELSPSGALRPADPRAAYVPLRFLEPPALGALTLGFDLAAQPVIAAAIERAHATQRAAATAPLALWRAGGRAAPGYAVLAPAYGASAQEPIGLALGAVDAQRIVELAAPAAARAGLALAVTDVTDAEPRPVYTSARAAAVRSQSETIAVAGRRWQVSVGFAAPPPPSLSTWLVLAGGLAGVGLLGTVLLLVTCRASRVAIAEERYRDLYEHAPDMYLSIRIDDGEILECNQTTARVLGRDRSELVGRSVYDVYAAGSRERARAAMATLPAAAAVQATDLQVVCADGKLLDVGLHATVHGPDPSRATRTRAVWRDLTAEKQIDRDRSFLLELGEHLAVGGEPIATAREVIADLAGYLGAPRAALWELAADRETFTRYEHDPEQPPRAVPATAAPLSGLAQVMDGHVLAIDDVARHPRSAPHYAEAHAPRGVRAILSVPLVRDGGVAGLLEVASATPRSWTPREIGLVQTVSERLWLWVEHVRTVHALRESERHHRRIVETAHEGIWQLDRDLRTTFVNPRMATMLGYEPGELLGRALPELADEVPAAIALPAAPAVRVEDVRLVHRSGHALWTRFSMAPIVDAEGRAAGTLAMVADLTERVRMEEELRVLSRDLEARVAQRTEALAESERRFRSLFAESPMSLIEGDFSPALAFLDAQRGRGVTDMRPYLEEAARRVRVVAVNEASLDIFGAESEGQLIAALPRIFGREAFAMFRAEVREWRDGRSRLETEASVRTLAGATKSISLRLSVIPGHERDWTRVVVSIFDLTAHKEAEAFARTALHEKEVLLKEVHHRVKNNLQVISSLLSLQAHRHDDPRLRAAFADSKARVQSIALVHERLYRARDLSRVNLDEYLHTLVEGLAMAHDAERRGIHARVEASRTRVPVDIAIPAGLVVNELVMNSLKYAFPDGRSGAISVTVRPPSPGMVELTVSDDGVGLPPDVDPRHSKTLGLDLVFTFAQQLGAEIEVSRDGGTRFTLVFSATDR